MNTGIALIKDKIKNSQIKASIKVNRELLELYWHIGSDIVNRQKHSKWGEGLLRQMSIDLKKTFPDMSGFSETNLKTMRDDYDEKELEDALVNQITQFLLELGTGFSYVGRQVHLQVGEREFYIDLLFYHIKLHCYVVVELKTKRFEPEYVGKLNFYVTAVNKQFTGDGDNPAIGLLICKDKDNVVAEYSLEEVSQPIGIAGYELTNALSKEYQRSLPTIETLESEVAKMMDIK